VLELPLKSVTNPVSGSKKPISSTQLAFFPKYSVSVSVTRVAWCTECVKSPFFVVTNEHESSICTWLGKLPINFEVEVFSFALHLYKWCQIPVQKKKQGGAQSIQRKMTDIDFNFLVPGSVQPPSPCRTTKIPLPIHFSWTKAVVPNVSSAGTLSCTKLRLSGLDEDTKAFLHRPAWLKNSSQPVVAINSSGYGICSSNTLV
jgi:hypothetical protein